VALEDCTGSNGVAGISTLGVAATLVPTDAGRVAGVVAEAAIIDG
jgi:hypothetical protein